MNHLDFRSILVGLGTRYIGRNLIYLPTIGSTNDVAKSLANQGAPEGTLVIADEQTAGRGRLGRQWIAPSGSSLLLSLVFYPPLSPAQAHRLTMLCSLAIVDAIEVVTGLQTGIKWPNDIVTMADGRWQMADFWFRKLAGLLTESGIMGQRLSYLVVGMGINVNLDVSLLPETITPATSLSAELGHPVDRLALLGEILAGIERRYDALQSPNANRQSAIGNLQSDWSSRLVTLGQWVRVSGGETILEGLAEAVDADGALLLRDAHGRLQRVVVGDVTMRQSGDQ